MQPKQRRMKIMQRQKRRQKRSIATHGIGFTDYRLVASTDPFLRLKSILSTGFHANPSVEHSNVAVHETKVRVQNPLFFAFSRASNFPETAGDKYVIEMKTKVEAKFGGFGTVRHVRPGQIKTIFVKLDGKLGEHERELRRNFYKNNFPKVKVQFV